MGTSLRGIAASEMNALTSVILEASEMAAANQHKRPKMTTLVEEFAEAVLASRGKHEHPTRLEVMQMITVGMNIVWQIDLYGEQEVCNLRAER
jgi:hypothetical protein